MIKDFDVKVETFLNDIRQKYPNRVANARSPVGMLDPIVPLEAIMQSTDTIWSVNVSSSALSLTCTRYTVWNEFKGEMAFLVEQFCKCFKVGTITRVGLRYINAIKPSTIGLMNENQVLDGSYQHILSPLLGDVIGAHMVLEYQRSDDIKGRSIIGNIVFSDGEKGIMVDDDLYVESNLPMTNLGESLMRLNKESLEVFKSIVSHNVQEKVV